MHNAFQQENGRSEAIFLPMNFQFDVVKVSTHYWWSQVGPRSGLEVNTFLTAGVKMKHSVSSSTCKDLAEENASGNCVTVEYFPEVHFLLLKIWESIRCDQVNWKLFFGENQTAKRPEYVVVAVCDCKLAFDADSLFILWLWFAPRCFNTYFSKGTQAIRVINILRWIRLDF